MVCAILVTLLALAAQYSEVWRVTTVGMRVALGIDIGGTKIAAGLVIKDAATSPSVITSPTPATAGAGQIMASVFQLCERALGEVDAPVDVTGVGSAGTIDSAGRVIAATSLLRDWVGTEIAADLSEKFGVRAVCEIITSTWRRCNCLMTMFCRPWL